MNTSTKFNRRHALVAAVSLALGTSMVPQLAAAKEYTFEWTGYFIMLDSGGNCLANTSTSVKLNQCVTPIDGTLVYDDVAGTGSMTIDTFQFFNGDATLPATAANISLESIGDGAGGAGTLMLSNMLFNWNTNSGIPVSLAFDADGIINAAGVLDVLTVSDVVTGVGAIPASDGTYVGGVSDGYLDGAGYLAMGAMPLATTAWNTTATGPCLPGDCMLVNPSGTLPLVLDVEPNTAYDGANAGGTIGGNPMADGPFTGFNATFAVASMTLTSDGLGPTFTQPADVDEPATAIPGDTVSVDLGTVTDAAAPVTDATCNVTVEYSDDGGTTWTADNGTNTINVTLTGTVTTLNVDWRATTTTGDPGTCAANTTTSHTQVVTVTINDVTAPTFTVFPADFSVSVDSTAELIAFEGPTSSQGTVTVSDAVDTDPLIEWSLDELTWTADTAGTDESSNGFGSGANTVYWRVTDAAGNERTQQQTVTVNLPAGIVGQPCDTPDAVDIDRAMVGVFTMRDSVGNTVGEIDETVTGTMNTATILTDESETESGAALATTQAFFGNLWDTEAIRLFGEGTYTFNACPGTIDGDGVSTDGSTQCDGDDTLTLTVGPGQLGGHMLFNWSVNRKIDVAVVWDYSCGASQLVAADPDGDGVIGTKMVDGPFKGFNAAFDLNTASGETRITEGGYTVSVPVVNNPVSGASPLPIDPGTVGTALGGVSFTGSELSGWGAADDSRVVTSCVGGCFDFSISGRTTGETIQVVLPLSEPIPYYSLYRKYDVGAGSWKAFVTNATDSVTTAPLDADGRCPEPGAGDYTSYSNGILAGMLRPDDQCVQLTITDNGPNDDDPADGTIADPSGVGLTSAPAAPTTQTTDDGLGGGGCALDTNASATQRLDLWLLASVMAFFGLRRKTQQK